MIISHSNKFIFLHIPKTAGISIKTALTKYCSFDINCSGGNKNIRFISKLFFKMASNDLRRSDSYNCLNSFSKALLKLINLELKTGTHTLTTYKELEKLLHNPSDYYHVFKAFCNKSYPNFYSRKEHVSALNVKKYLSNDVFKSYFKFAIVRNPMDWLYSYYDYYVKDPKTRWMDFSNINTKEEFINYAVKNKNIPVSGQEIVFNSPQYSFLCNHKGEMLVDYIGRFENLEEDWQIITKRIGLENIQLPHRNFNKNKVKDSKLNQEYKNKIFNLFENDYKYFKYRFD